MLCVRQHPLQMLLIILSTIWPSGCIQASGPLLLIVRGPFRAMNSRRYRDRANRLGNILNSSAKNKMQLRSARIASRGQRDPRGRKEE